MTSPNPDSTINWATVETQAANLLSRYLQFDTTNPPGNETPALELLAQILMGMVIFSDYGKNQELVENAPLNYLGGLKQNLCNQSIYVDAQLEILLQ